MANFLMYTRPNCGYCTKAKALLEGLGHTIEQRDISEPTILQELRSSYPEARTVPQIYIGGFRIGGHDDLVRMIDSGTPSILDMMIESCAE